MISLPPGGRAALSGMVPRIPARPAPPQVLGVMKKGGKVKRTGLYKLHKGETVRGVRDVTSNAYDFRKGKKR